MYDIHCHILPGIDDGPKNWGDSLELCRAMVDDGIEHAIATPHLIDGVYENTRPVVAQLTRELVERLDQASIPLSVLPGAEVDLASNYVSEFSPDLPLLGDRSAVLLEMPVAVIPQAMSEIIFNICSHGVIPILAHPERNEILVSKPQLATDWISSGAALQLDGDSLLGVWGRQAERLGKELLLKGQIHAMASDAHSCKTRPPRLREAMEHATALVGESAQDLVSTGPQTLLAGRLPETGTQHDNTRTKTRRSGNFLTRLFRG